MKPGVYRVASLAFALGISVIVLVAALLLLFVNPINWKLFQDMTVFDKVWLVASNVAIMSSALVLVWLTWGKLWRVSKNAPNYRVK